MEPALLLSLIVAAAVVVSAPWLFGRWVSARVAAQRVEQHPDDERALVVLLRGDPALTATIPQLQADHFTLAGPADVYRQLSGRWPGDPDAAVTASPPQDPPAELSGDAAATVEALADDPAVAAHVDRAREDADRQLQTARRRWWLTRRFGRDRVDPDGLRADHVAVFQMAGRIWGSAVDRDVLNGPSPIVWDGHRLVRQPVPVRRRWQWTAAAAAAASTVVGGHAAATTISGAGWQAAAVLLLAAASAVGIFHGLVDLYTYYVDRATLRPASWLLLAGTAVVAVGSPGGLRRAALGLVGIAALAALMVPAVAIVGWVKRQTAWGGGDTQMLPAVMVVPTVLTGAVLLPLWSMVATALVAAVVALPRRWRHRQGPAPAMVPLVPFLTAGWPIAWGVLQLTGMPLTV